MKAISPPEPALPIHPLLGAVRTDDLLPRRMVVELVTGAGYILTRTSVAVSSPSSRV
jgi:hypothetical protein